MTYWKKSIVNSTMTHTQAIRVEIFLEELILLNITMLNSMVTKKKRFQFKNKWLPYSMGLFSEEAYTRNQ